MKQEICVAKALPFQRRQFLADRSQRSVVDDHSAQDEDRVAVVDARQAVVAGLIEEGMVHGAMLSKRLGEAQSDNQSSILIPHCWSHAAVSSSSRMGGT